jgi:ABC-2 type transport system permease protein
MTHTASAVATIAYRDFLKLLRDRPRIFSSLVFPVVIIGVLGTTLQATIRADYSYLTFIFTGVLAQTLYDSAASGLISLIEDRESDFSQAIFVAPVSRYAIVGGKIVGESMVSLVQGFGIVVVAMLLGVRITLAQLPLMLAVAVVSCLVGASFGLVVLVNLRSRRAAQQVFPMLLLPQFFLAGVFAPVSGLGQNLSVSQPAVVLLNVLSHLTPLRYAVDLMRGVFYGTSPTYGAEAHITVAAPPLWNLAVLVVVFGVFLVVGTTLFVRSERNR